MRVPVVKLRSGVAPLRSVADTTPRARDELRGKRLYLSNFGPGGVKPKLLLTITNVKEKRSDRKSVPKFLQTVARIENIADGLSQVCSRQVTDL